jgi:hypothetical protein
MSSKITVNGVEYGSLEAMPPEARKLYEQAMAQMPELVDRNGDGVPDVAQGKGGPIQLRTTVRKRFVVNGVTYDDESALPPAVRQAFEKAMSAANAGGSGVEKDGVQILFQTGAPKFKLSFHSDLSSDRGAGPAIKPIEPSGIGGLKRAALVLTLFVAVGFALWFLTRAR